MKNKGFTLAEILGVIVIIGLLLVLIAPTIINRLSSNSDDPNETMNQFIYNSTLIYINENVQKYPPGKSSKYCVPIKDLVESGELPPLCKVSSKMITSSDTSNCKERVMKIILLSNQKH